MQDKPTILVSGGAGYIGSHTALALQESGYKPVVVDSLVTGHEWAAKFGPFRKGDVGDKKFIAEVCQEFKPAALIHFAAFIEVGESVKNPDKYFENNTTKASRLFDTVLENGVKHVVFSSTAAVYGAVNSEQPITENQPKKPINPYGESKLNAEEYLRSLGEKGMTSFALRYFNASGDAPIKHGIGEAHWPESHLIPNAVLAATNADVRKLSVFGTDYPTKDGTNIRDYVHVQDLAAAHIKAVEYLLNGGPSEVCNLGTGKGNSVLQIIEAVERYAGPVNKTFGERREGDPPILVADFSRAKKVLGWEPQRNLDEIVRTAVEWHKSPHYQALLKQNLAKATP